MLALHNLAPSVCQRCMLHTRDKVPSEPVDCDIPLTVAASAPQSWPGLKATRREARPRQAGIVFDRKLGKECSCSKVTSEPNPTAHALPLFIKHLFTPVVAGVDHPQVDYLLQ